MARLLCLIQTMLILSSVLYYGYAERRRRQVNINIKKWPNETIPFMISTITEPPYDNLNNFLAYTNEFTSTTCLKFEYNSAYYNLIFEGGMGIIPCTNRLPQGAIKFKIVFVNHLCAEPYYISRLIGRLFGLYYEVQRSDRDNNINVTLTNIKAEDQDKYTKLTAAEADNYNYPFDYGSVMMFDTAEHKKDNGAPSFEAKNDRFMNTVGQKMGMSHLDLMRLSKFNCDGFSDAATDCENGGFKIGIAICVCPRGYGGATCNTIAAAVNMDGCTPSMETAADYWKDLKVSGLKINKRELHTAAGYNGRCTWWITATEGKQIELEIKAMTFAPAAGRNETCDVTCKLAGLDIKAEADKRPSGSRHCCVADRYIEKNITSENHMVVLNFDIVYTAIDDVAINSIYGFTVKYRLVAQPTTTAATTTVTTTRGGAMMTTGENAMITKIAGVSKISKICNNNVFWNCYGI